MLNQPRLSLRTTASVGLLLALCLGCIRDSLLRSTLVPLPTLPSMPAHGGAFEVSVASSTLTAVSEPNYAGTASSLYVPREQLEGAISVRGGRRFAARMNWLAAISTDTLPLAGTALGTPRGPLFGVGPGVTLRVGALDQPWFVELSADALLLSVPSDVRDCAAPCPPDTSGRHVGEGVFLFSAGAFAGMHLTPEVAVVFATAVRTQPTTGATSPGLDASTPVELGSATWLMGFGVELRLRPWLGLAPMVQWPITASPVRYAPILTLGLSFHTPGTSVAMGDS